MEYIWLPYLVCRLVDLWAMYGKGGASASQRQGCYSGFQFPGVLGESLRLGSGWKICKCTKTVLFTRVCQFAIGTTVNSTTRDLLVALLGKFEPRVVMLCVLLRPTCASSALASWQELKPLGIGCSSSLSDKSHLGFVGGKFATLIPLWLKSKKFRRASKWKRKGLPEICCRCYLFVVVRCRRVLYAYRTYCPLEASLRCA